MEIDDAESVFYMKPRELIEALARQLVDGQVALAKIREIEAGLPDDDPRAAEFRAQAADVTRKWLTVQLPDLAATFRLALEVLDTYGPEGIRVEDGVDAAIWNNKHTVWVMEFGGTLPEKS